MKFETGILKGYAKEKIKIQSVDFYNRIWEFAEAEQSEYTGVCLAASCLWGINSVMQGNYCDFNALSSDRKILEILWNAQKLYEEVNPGNFLGEVDNVLTGFRMTGLNTGEIDNLPVFENKDFAFLAVPDHFECLPENSACLLCNSIQKNDGHVVAFYKRSDGKIFFFDVNEGIYSVKNIQGLLNTRDNQTEHFSMVRLQRPDKREEQQG